VVLFAGIVLVAWDWRFPLPGGEPPGSGAVLVVSLPPEAALPGTDPLRVAVGGRLEIVDGAEVRFPASGLSSAGAPSVNFDGRSVVLAGRRSEAEEDSLWIVPSTGGEPRPIVRRAGGCGRPAWLPDGRIAFVARDGEAVALHTVAADGSDVRRITFFRDGEDGDPAVLPDGRILFTHRERGETGDVLYTVHVDGTGIEGYHGAGDRATARRRPRPGTARSVVYAVPGPSGGLLRVDTRRPFRAADPLGDGDDGVIGSASPAPEGRWILSRGPAPGRETWAIVRADGSGRTMGVLRDDPRRHEVDAVPLAPRPRPQGHLSLVKPAESTGRLLVVDARRGRDRERNLQLAAAVRARLTEGERILGEIPLAADGSLFATVPADRALEIVLLDGEGRTLSTSGARFWVRPNETRACLGCHEHPAETPPNVLPLAVGADPVDLTGPGGER